MTIGSMYESPALLSHGFSLGIGLPLRDSISTVSGRRLLQHLFAYAAHVRSTKESFSSLFLTHRSYLYCAIFGSGQFERARCVLLANSLCTDVMNPGAPQPGVGTRSDTEAALT